MLINVAEQVEGFDRNVGAVNPALQQAPKVLGSVGVDLPVDLRFSMVDDLMLEGLFQPVIGLQRVAEEG